MKVHLLLSHASTAAPAAHTAVQEPTTGVRLASSRFAGPATQSPVSLTNAGAGTPQTALTHGAVLAVIASWIWCGLELARSRRRHRDAQTPQAPAAQVSSEMTRTLAAQRRAEQLAAAAFGGSAMYGGDELAPGARDTGSAPAYGAAGAGANHGYG